MTSVEWLGDDIFQIADVTFRAKILDKFKSSGNHVMLAKPRHMIERYDALFSALRPKRIVELGIFEGGSAAFFSLLTNPERLVALDIKEEPAVGLEHFVSERHLQDRLRTYYSFDQADGARLRAMIASEFAGEPIDLVVDDASHLLGPTRASFNALFPQLRPGGVFVIEDWSWLHQIDALLRMHAENNPSVRARIDEHARTVGASTETPLSVLLFELVLASAYAPTVFAEVVVADGWAHVVRGAGDLNASDFDMSRVYSEAAQTLIARTS